MTKPRTKEEIEKDIATHPDRGLINGKKVVNDEPREVRAKIPSALKRKLLRVRACYGIDITDVLEMAVVALWRQEQLAVESHERDKAAEFGVSVQDIQMKSFGYYKDVGRRKRLNFTKTKEDE